MSLLHTFRRLSMDRRGNFAIIAGLATVPIVMALGCAIDIGSLYDVESQAQQAADAATLVAAKRMETGTVSDAVKDADVFGRAQLTGDMATFTLSSVVDQTKGTVTSTVKGEFKPSFAKLMKIDRIPVERVSVAAIRQNGYMDFQFLLDVSESKNIAASEDDRKKLMATTKAKNNRPCAFACHTVEPGWSLSSIYQMNQDAKDDDRAKLRIDVLRSAADDMIGTILQKNADPGSLLDIRIQTNGFGFAFQKGFGPDTDPVQLKNSIRNFSVANSHTSFAAALTGLSQQLGTQGTGKQASSRRKVALVITDGVKDENFSSAGLGPITPALCDAIKANKFDLAVLEIEYVEDYDYQGYYRDRVASYRTKISPNLAACASPGLYYKVADSLQARSALLKLTEKLVTQSLHIVQ